MSALRTIASALSILLGVALIAAWALAAVVVNVVEDGTAARAMTAQALDSPAFIDTVAHDVSEHAGTALRDQGVDVASLGLESQLTGAMTRVVGSQAFRTALLNQVDDAHVQFSDQLTDPLRAPAPLTITVDVSESVSERVRDLGGVAAALPSLQVEPVAIQVLDAERFEQAREAYVKVQWAHNWGLWLGLGALAVGFVISHRKRWFVAKVLFGFAALSLGLAGIVTLVGPETLTGFLPGAEGGIWGDAVGAQAATIVVERSLLIGVIALLGGLIAVAIGAAVGDRRR